MGRFVELKVNIESGIGVLHANPDHIAYVVAGTDEPTSMAQIVMTTGKEYLLAETIQVVMGKIDPPPREDEAGAR